MKSTATFTLGFITCGVIVVLAVSEQEAYLKAKHQKEVDRLTDLLAKRNGETARANKDSTYYIKNK